MATQTVEFVAASGQAITAKVFAVGSDSVVASESATEATNRKGVYTATFTNVPAGVYRLLAIVGSVTVAAWWVKLEDTTATFPAYEIPDHATGTGLSSAAANISSIKAVTDQLPDSGSLTTIQSALTLIDSLVDSIKAVTDQLPDSGALTDLVAAVDLVKTQTDKLNFTGDDVQAVASNPATPLTEEQVKTQVSSALANYNGVTRAEAIFNRNAIISRGDAAWVTGSGGGGGGLTKSEVREAVGLQEADLDSQLSNILQASASISMQVNAVVGTGQVKSQPIHFYLAEGKSVVISVIDENGDSIDMTGKQLEFVVRTRRNKDVLFSKSGSDLSIAGNVVTVSVSSGDVSGLGTFDYALRDLGDGDRVWAEETFHIAYAAPKVS